MQVFMPFPSLQASVQCLDPPRLGNQVYRECKTLITDNWTNHPAYKIWENHKPALALYAIYGIEELRTRTRNPNIYTNHYIFFQKFLRHPRGKYVITLPPIVGNPLFHKSHRLNLLYKNPSYYSKIFKEPVPTSKPIYYWGIS